MTHNSSVPCFILWSVPEVLAEFRHNRIVQSPHENYFNVMSAAQRKVRSREDDNYSNWAIISYGVYKDFIIFLACCK